MLPGVFRRPLVLSAILLVASAAPAIAQAPSPAPPPTAAPAARPRVGVAFGGGSARGLAHVGVVRWFEEHRIPIDVAAGTSMGGLIGGAYASGMSADELATLLKDTDWDEMFGASSFRYKNIRRKEDARAYPSRIELGLKRKISGPVALNNGQQVEFMLAKIAGPYGSLDSFDALPTPFRCVAVDLVKAEPVVLDRGSLATAMRATMSLPGVFPPVPWDDKVLVDGGAMNNVPADIVRKMGADVVVAVNVGSMAEKRTVDYSLLGLMGQTVDVMMTASTRAAMKGADVVINPPLVGFKSLDWRRSEALAEDGYQATEAVKDKLLPLALDETQWAAYQEQRKAKRKAGFPVPAFLTIEGAVSSDEGRMRRVLEPRVGQPLNVAGLETDLEMLAGLDRYESVVWRLAERDGTWGIVVDARQKANAPPFLMVGLSLQNTTSENFAFQLAARYLTFDTLGSGSELRFDAAAGASPTVGAELYEPLGRSPLFATLFAGAGRQTLNFITDDVVVAEYEQVKQFAGVGAGVNLGRDSDVRVLYSWGHVSTNVRAGDPGLPELSGGDERVELRWRYDGQDSVVVPTSGVRTGARLTHIVSAPDPPDTFAIDRTNDGITQLEVNGSVFKSLRKKRDRLFAVGGLGTTWGDPLPTEQFILGQPLRLGAYNIGEFRGDNYGLLTLGYLRGVTRLPDFLGGQLFLGGWLENGSAFNDIDDARLKTNVTIGGIGDTLLGPVILATSFDFNGQWRYYIGIGRLF
jgi:NTE family protein